MSDVINYRGVEAYIFSSKLASVTHELKTEPGQFDAVVAGAKTFEFRRDDRDFAEANLLLLRECIYESYTGRTQLCTVTHILKSGFGIPDGYVVMSIKKVEK